MNERFSQILTAALLALLFGFTAAVTATIQMPWGERALYVAALVAVGGILGALVVRKG